MKKKTITKKIQKLSAKSHKIPCRECGTDTVCAAEAKWVICPMCVAKHSVLIVRGKAANPKRKKKTTKKKVSKK